MERRQPPPLPHGEVTVLLGLLLSESKTAQHLVAGASAVVAAEEGKGFAGRHRLGESRFLQLDTDRAPEFTTLAGGIKS